MADRMQKNRNQLADSKKKKKKNALGSAMKILHRRDYKVLNAMLSIKTLARNPSMALELCLLEGGRPPNQEDL